MSERLTKYNHVIVTEGKKIEFKCSTCGTLDETRDIKSFILKQRWLLKNSEAVRFKS